MPLAALIIVPLAGIGFAYFTTLYVTDARRLSGRERARVVMQARWTAAATGVALLIVGLLIR